MKTFLPSCNIVTHLAAFHICTSRFRHGELNAFAKVAFRHMFVETMMM